MTKNKFKNMLAMSSMVCLSNAAASRLLADASADSPSDNDEVAGLPQITVTAQKREENMEKVGLTISAISADTLQERNIQSLADVAAAVPGLSYINSANNTPVYNLRGVGFYDTSLGSYPTTSVYLDQAALPFPVLTNLTAFDLERIEVLKGPQGTLFGQNSTGGAINYIANKPTQQVSAGGQATYGRFNDFVGSAYVSGPLADNLRGRIAVQGETSDDWQYSYTRNAYNGAAHNMAGRILLDWNPLSTLKFELNLNGWIDRNAPEATQYFKFNQQKITNVSDAVRDYPTSPDNPRAADWSANNRMFRDLHFAQSTLRGDWEFMPDISLTSITSYIDFTEKGALDQDGINYEDIDLRYFTGNIHSFSQELRVANSGDSLIRWILGGNFSGDHVYYLENIVYGDGSGGNNQAAPFQIESSENFSDQYMQNYAGFGDLEWSPLEQMTVKGGVRYSNAQRKADICNKDGTLTANGGPADRNFPAGGANRLFDLLGSLLSGGTAYPPIPVDGCFNLDDPSPLNPDANAATPYKPGLFVAKINESNVSWRGGFDYKPSDALLLYVNVSKGFKAGGFGNINAAIDYQFRPVKQESVLDYEAGFKTNLADQRISIDGAAFYMDYKDKQLRTKDINPIFGIIDALNNIPKSRIEGGELEIKAVPFKGLSVGIAGTYLDSRIDSYSGINAGGIEANFAGSVIPFTPKWQFGTNARYEVPLGADLKGFTGAQLDYRSHTYAVVGGGIGLADDYFMNSYSTLDAQLGVEGTTSHWRAFIWGKNITDRYYWTNVVAGQDQIVRYAGRPATFGITGSYDF